MPFPKMTLTHEWDAEKEGILRVLVGHHVRQSYSRAVVPAASRYVQRVRPFRRPVERIERIALEDLPSEHADLAKSAVVYRVTYSG